MTGPPALHFVTVLLGWRSAPLSFFCSAPLTQSQEGFHREWESTRAWICMRAVMGLLHSSWLYNLMTRRTQIKCWNHVFFPPTKPVGGFKIIFLNFSPLTIILESHFPEPMPYLCKVGIVFTLNKFYKCTKSIKSFFCSTSVMTQVHYKSASLVWTSLYFLSLDQIHALVPLLEPSLHP